MKTLLRLAILVLALGILGRQTANADDGPPNIVFILADDLGSEMSAVTAATIVRLKLLTSTLWPPEDCGSRMLM